MKIKILIILLSLPGIMLAQDDKTAFTLAEAQQYALDNHLRVQNAKLEYEESVRKVKETTAIGLPQVSAQANVQYNIDIPVTVVDATTFDPSAPSDEVVALQFGQDNNANASINATQLIFDGTFFVGLQASKTYKELMNQNIDKTEIEVKDMVSRSYYNALIAEANKNVFEENVEKLEGQMEQLQQMFEAGFIEEIEVDQLDLILSDAEKRLQTIERQISITYQILNFQMGRDINAPITLTEDLQTIYSNYDEGALLNDELQIENHIDYKLIETTRTIKLVADQVG